MAIAMNLDSHFELRQSGFSTATLSWFYSMRLRIRLSGPNQKPATKLASYRAEVVLARRILALGW
jgi:hypothetical protein